MKNSFTRSLLITSIAALVGSVASSPAQVIYSLTWESGPTSPGYDQADPGGITALSTVANGPGSSLARNLTFDTTASPFSISYFANFNTKVNAATSNFASDYILSFNVRADGLANGNDGYGEFSVVFNDTTFTKVLSVTNTFQTISFALSDMTLTGGTFDATDFNSGNQRWRINQQGISGVGRYGTKTGNVLIFDNVKVEQIPEPTSLALLGLTGMALLGFRRRRSA